MYNKQKLSLNAIKIAEIAKISQNDLKYFYVKDAPGERFRFEIYKP